MNDRRLRVISGSDQDAAAILAVLDDTSIRIVLPAGVPTWEHQLLAITLVDLLGRLFPRVHVDGLDEALADPALPPGTALLADRVAAAHGHGGLVRAPLHTDPYTVRIGTGTEPADLYVDAAGWQSYTGTAPSRLRPAASVAVPIGPLAAACRAAALITDHALASLRPARPPQPSVYASALTYTTGVDPLDEPTPVADHLDAVLVGAGSIGGAAVYAFTHTPALAGRLVIVDPQRLEPRNLDRALLATAAVAEKREPKVAVASAALEHHPDLAVEPFEGTITDYHATLARNQPLPTVLAAVDSAASRRAIQDCLPLDLINAACHPHEITVSGHRTDLGPCVCCLHMTDLLNRDLIKMRLIAQATGFPEPAVTELLVTRAPLTPAHLRHVERHRRLAAGALDRYLGQTLHALWDGELLYGATPVTTRSGTVAVAAPFVTALAGVLLAGEALKAGTPELGGHRLGPDGPATKYTENPYATPLHAQLSNPPRWPTSECLCRSSRRLRILRQLYVLHPRTVDAPAGRTPPT